VVPLNTTVTALPPAAYVYNEPNPPNTSFLAPFPSPCLDTGIRPLPHFGLTISNRLQVAIIDYSAGAGAGHIVDYVQLGDLNSSRDLAAEIQAVDPYGFFDTNEVDGGTIGVLNQIFASRTGQTFTGQSVVGSGWTTTPYPNRTDEMAFFSAFFSNNSMYNIGGTNFINTLTNMEAPYTPTITAVQEVSWQVNDPLIHSFASDLGPRIVTGSITTWPDSVGKSNQRYLPWGQRLFTIGIDPNPCNLAFKDPAVRSSDNWNFPSNQTLNAAWLGRIHRGTPWQTLYLKSTNILDYTKPPVSGLATWTVWTGDPADDATNMAPVRDWHLVSYLASLISTNDLVSQFSVNEPDPNTWLALLDGMTALTNDLSDAAARFVAFGAAPHFDTIVISSNSPQAGIIASAIQTGRSAQPGRLFTDVGDLFSVLPLTEQSPFLNWLANVQRTNAISDEAFETIAAQLLPHLRADSIGSLASSNGRLLHFTGYDDHTYIIQASSDLINWTVISTNAPDRGTIVLTNTTEIDPVFFRSLLFN